MDDLFDAISRGDGNQVRRLLDARPHLLDAERGGTSALMYALYTGHGELVSMFRDLGRKLSIHEACAIGDSARVTAMLDADASLASVRSGDGFTPVGLAIFFRQPAVARLLIQRGGDFTSHSTNPQRVAPVHAAAAVDDLETMQLLLERGADANARQQNDFTPLHGAASRGSISMAELLLAHGADVEAKTADGMTVADVARKYQREEFEQWFAARNSATL
jgi:ankyrin repeat protein